MEISCSHDHQLENAIVDYCVRTRRELSDTFIYQLTRMVRVAGSNRCPNCNHDLRCHVLNALRSNRPLPQNFDGF